MVGIDAPVTDRERAQVLPTLARFRSLEVLGSRRALILFGMFSVFAFWACGRLAREGGLIDRGMNY